MTKGKIDHPGLLRIGTSCIVGREGIMLSDEGQIDHLSAGRIWGHHLPLNSYKV